MKTRVAVRLVKRMGALGFCGAWALVAAASGSPPGFGRTIAAITAGQDYLDRVRSLYGPGAQTTVTGVQSICYYVERDQSYLSISTFAKETRVRGIVLSAFADVAPGCRDAKIKGKHLTASQGIALGDPMSRVMEILGGPAKPETVRIGDHELAVLDYPVPGGRATCQFEHGKLVLIGIELE